MIQIKPKVSIILTSFNHAKYLREAIDSALAQTFTDFELIIWDDASSDNSWEIIQSYQDPRIKAFKNDVQMRGIYGINKAISEVAQGEYIAIHHSDDVWEPNKLEKQMAFLDGHADVGAVFTNALAIGEESEPFSDESHFYYKIFDQPNRTRHEWLRFFFEKGNALCHPSVLIRKQCYKDCGLYRYGLAQLGDMDMWVRLVLRYEIHVLPEKLVRFRVREGEANTSGNRQETRSRGLYEFTLLLQNYLLIEDFHALIQIFPEAEKYFNAERKDLRYALARAMLDVKSFAFVTQFALDILFELLNQPNEAPTINFKATDFIKLTGDLDPLQLRRIEVEYGDTVKQVQALTEWATSADAHAKSKVEEVDQLHVALEAERQAREAEHTEAVKQVQALTEWATSADAHAKSKVEEVDQLHVALEAERQAREAEHTEAVKQVQALTEWATSADAHAKSKVEEVEQLHVALEAERQAREAEHTEAVRQVQALTGWATSADAYAKSKVEDVEQLHVALEAERQAREAEHTEAVKQVQALTGWATSADAYAKSKVEEVEQLHVALEAERQAREAEHTEAVRQVQALTGWATSADAYAKSKVEDVEQLHVALEAERQAREAEHTEAVKQVQALTGWATSADAYAKSKVEEVEQLHVALEAERQAREAEHTEAVRQVQALTVWATSADAHAKSKVEEVEQLQREIASLKYKLTSYQEHWIYRVFPHPNSQSQS